MSPTTILALHGFGGSSRSWDTVAARLDPRRFRLCAVDLRGHGSRSDHRPIELEDVLDDLRSDLDALDAAEPVILAGYSLGGRMALHLALEEQRRIAHLVLISSTPGTPGEHERASRRMSDELQAAWLLENGSQAFADRWGRMPLWEGDPPAVREAQRAEIAAADPEGLAAVLRGLGPGAVPAVWHRLATLAVPLTVVAGARDRRYCDIARRVVELAAKPAGEVVVPGAGHGLLRESPAAVAEALGALG
ncbi:2-succinyl-6-hydroxy-24-cyclohexadiene-1-carboxylate synthase [Patulibacter medicamentivorans]|uniref:2-succinyl-6-hydroxy-24-cyclohexadiene-1-carboxylate synthase n=1 Tax=Patulibacter medicamentivorans TaxID=1097667 RepID=H0E225_9ACTN|nr:alpha/beta fold hydrolase [Patulibacter medicamentivorans]EHN12235.1 2-succinyl-6-hydroxy-24-cyclohexadiene-1-carboxylate synthase [Patulibacter medicamentivorans]